MDEKDIKRLQKLLEIEYGRYFHTQIPEDFKQQLSIQLKPFIFEMVNNTEDHFCEGCVGRQL
jgi:hypothetical protein